MEKVAHLKNLSGDELAAFLGSTKEHTNVAAKFRLVSAATT